jgi:pyruvate dehydrogenase E1 component beta subunit
VGAEVAAEIAEKGILDLAAPVVRVTGYDTVMPYYKLEKKYIPTVDRILKAVHHVMEF